MNNSYDKIQLEKEHKELLYKIVEASRNLLNGRRSEFFVIRDSVNTCLQHSGLPNNEIEFYYNDLEVLNGYGMLQVTHSDQYGIVRFDIHPSGIDCYKYLKKLSNEPVNNLGKEIRNYINSPDFQKEYPQTHEKWLKAERLLWESDSIQQLTTIGHLCREAITEYIDNLVNQYNPPNAEMNKSSTKNRLKSVIDSKASDLGKTEKAFLDALYCFWESVSDLIQRQEHGAKREKEKLIWEDGRRVVFQTMVVIYEIDKALKRT